jgi:hypothetical protein
MNNNIEMHELDPVLQEKISLMEKTPERDPELAAQTRENYLAQVDSLPLRGSTTALGWVLGFFGLNSLGNSAVSSGKRKFAFSSVAAILLVLVVLFGGASATAYAAQSALPGDALYPVKTSLEQTRITLANDAYNQAQLHLQFAQRRLNEIKELLAQGRTNDIEFASSEFEYYIQEAMKASQIVLAADSERGAELNKLVSQALLEYAGALKSVLLTAPEAVKPVVEGALLASQEGAGDKVEIFGIVEALSETEIEIDGVVYSITDLTEFEDFIQPGDMVKVHVIKTNFGVMVVREIELNNAFEDNSNESGSDNSNESSGGNGNENESDDDNSSGENSNEDETGDDLNENESNENSGDHENESDDDSNENDSNENHNEDDSEDNSSGSGSSNEDNSNEDASDDNRNENDSEEDNENSNESESNENDSEEEEDNKNGDD